MCICVRVYIHTYRFNYGTAYRGRDIKSYSARGGLVQILYGQPSSFRLPVYLPLDNLEAPVIPYKTARRKTSLSRTLVTGKFTRIKEVHFSLITSEYWRPSTRSFPMRGTSQFSRMHSCRSRVVWSHTRFLNQRRPTSADQSRLPKQGRQIDITICVWH